MLGWSTNTLYTQVMGAYQPAQTYTVMDKKTNSSRYRTYKIYLINHDNKDKRQLDLSYGFYKGVDVGNTLTLREKCSILSCYVHEDDIITKKIKDYSSRQNW